MGRRRRTREETENLLLAEYEGRLPGVASLRRLFSRDDPDLEEKLRLPSSPHLTGPDRRARALDDFLVTEPDIPKWLRRFRYSSRPPKLTRHLIVARPTESTRTLLARRHRLGRDTVQRYIEGARRRRRQAVEELSRLVEEALLAVLFPEVLDSVIRSENLPSLQNDIKAARRYREAFASFFIFTMTAVLGPEVFLCADLSHRTQRLRSVGTAVRRHVKAVCRRCPICDRLCASWCEELLALLESGAAWPPGQRLQVLTMLLAIVLALDALAPAPGWRDPREWDLAFRLVALGKVAMQNATLLPPQEWGPWVDFTDELVDRQCALARTTAQRYLKSALPSLRAEIARRSGGPLSPARILPS